MTIEEIKQLIQVLKESAIAELELTRGSDKVRIRAFESMRTVQVPAEGIAPITVEASKPATAAAAPAKDDSSIVTSPIVGTFYEAASPGAPPFVKVGDRVSKGQTLCIIESMKLMNEIESEYAGVVTERLVENGKPVEYGQPLFKIKA